MLRRTAPFAHRLDTFYGPTGVMQKQPEQYHQFTRILHAAIGTAMIGATGTILGVQSYPAWDKCDKAEGAAKSNLMFYHKSFGFLTFLLLGPRLLARAAYRIPAHAPTFTGMKLEKLGATMAHVLMYVFTIVMPLSGMLMTSFGGAMSIPFFVGNLPLPVSMKAMFGNPKIGGGEKPTPASGWFWWIHVKLGWMLPYVIPVHAGAAVAHQVRGHGMIQRMSPLAANAESKAATHSLKSHRAVSETKL